MLKMSYKILTADSLYLKFRRYLASISAHPDVFLVIMICVLCSLMGKAVAFNVMQIALLL